MENLALEKDCCVSMNTRETISPAYFSPTHGGGEGRKGRFFPTQHEFIFSVAAKSDFHGMLN